MTGAKGSSNDGGSSAEGHSPQKPSFSNVLELRTAGRHEFLSVAFRSLKGRELVVATRVSPPQFGELVELRNSGPAGPGEVVKAEVVGLERGHGEPGVVKVALKLDLEASEAIARFFPTSRRSKAPPGALASSPLFERFDEDDKPRTKRARGTPGAAEPKAGELEGSSGLSWGWVADDEAAFAVGNIRATPSGQLDVEAIRKALAGAAHGAGADIYSKLEEIWIVPPGTDAKPFPVEANAVLPESVEERDSTDRLSSPSLSPDVDGGGLWSLPPIEESHPAAPAPSSGAAKGAAAEAVEPEPVEPEIVLDPGEEPAIEAAKPRTGDRAQADVGRYTGAASERSRSRSVEHLGPRPRPAPSKAEHATPPRGQGAISGGYSYTHDKTALRGKRPAQPERRPEQERPAPAAPPTTARSRPARDLRRGSAIIERTGPERKPARRTHAKGGGAGAAARKAQRARERRRAAELGEAPVVAIDIGTMTSKVAVLDGEVILIEDRAATSATRAAVPSAVALHKGEWLVGEPARELLAVDGTRVITGARRLLGLSFSDEQAHRVLDAIQVPSRPGDADEILFDLGGESLTVIDVVSKIFEHLVEMATGWAGREVTRAVLTVPVDVEPGARKDLEAAARRAGLEIVAVVSEPVAAAMGCGFTGEKDSTVAVVDIGGGTCDVSIVKVSNDRFAVLGSTGDPWLGGADIDELLAHHIAAELASTRSFKLGDTAEHHRRLLFASEEAKRRLSSLESVDVILTGSRQTDGHAPAMHMTIERPQLVALIDDVIGSTLKVCEQASEAAGVSPKDVTSLLVTGGATRVPAVREAVELFFGRPAVAGIHPEHAVVVGAAVHGALISDVQVPPDFGARLRGIGTVSRQIGLALADGTTEPVIEASRRPPVAAHKLFCTSQDDQTACRIELVEGSSAATSENNKLGGFVIDGLPKRKAGETKLDIYFELNSSGTLCVTAQDRASGHRAQGIFAVPVK